MAVPAADLGGHRGGACATVSKQDLSFLLRISGHSSNPIQQWLMWARRAGLGVSLKGEDGGKLQNVSSLWSGERSWIDDGRGGGILPRTNLQESFAVNSWPDSRWFKPTLCSKLCLLTEIPELSDHWHSASPGVFAGLRFGITAFESS